MRAGEHLIAALALTAHPEGGWYRRTWVAPSGEDERPAGSAILYLLLAHERSEPHRIDATELWHFYAGAPLIVHVISREGSYSSFLLGQDLEAGQVLQAVVPAGCCFASHVADWNSFAVVGCTVAPGFDFEDFEMGKREELVERYPQH